VIISILEIKAFDGDRTTPPDFDWAQHVCLVGRGLLACRYLVATDDGLSCQKHGPMRLEIDQRIAAGKAAAYSDNCTGRASE